MKPFVKLWVLGVVPLALGLATAAQAQKSAAPAKVRSAGSKSESRADIVTAVTAAAQKDCGCSQCAARGCQPCHGKNCYFCAAKALVAKDCGCKQCNAKGCQVCGPGCDVCKFHLAPVAAAKAREPSSKK